jgi:hypothetical protein
LATSFNKEGRHPDIRELPAVGLAVATNESDLTITARSNPKQRVILTKTRKLPKKVEVLDLGLMGVRCLKGEKGQCINEPVRGLTVAKLLNPVKNIEVGMRILKAKYKLHGGDWLARYNGSGERKQGHPYAEKILAIRLAFEGKQGVVHGTRMRRMTSQIIEAVNAARIVKYTTPPTTSSALATMTRGERNLCQLQ